MFANLLGCTDGLLHKMKSVNPYYRNEWEKDRQLGTTFSERVDEIALLQSRLPDMAADEQAKWADLLEKLVKSDPSPEMRSLACQAISTVPGETAVRTLNSASTDQSEKVRLTACAGWRTRGGPEARDMLLTIAANTNETPSVRRAAIAGLSTYNDDEVKTALAGILDDKSPALQYQTALSLKSITNRDYGGDIQAWRDFMGGKDVPEPEKSLMASFWETVGVMR
jgi:HEAT repeat protein